MSATRASFWSGRRSRLRRVDEPAALAVHSGDESALGSITQRAVQIETELELVFLGRGIAGWVSGVAGVSAASGCQLVA
jgi:hypothetical protein